MEFPLERLRVEEAERILGDCVGRHGVWAGSGRYRAQCWTRDFAFANAPMLMEIGGYAIVRTHLEELSRRARPNGQVPILYLDGLRGHARFVGDKARKSARDGKMSFMLGRYLRGQLWNLTPGTRDSELLYLLAMGEYGRHDPAFLRVWRLAVDGAFRHVEQNLMRDGLVLGADWRDTMEKELADKALLTNNCLLARAYALHGRECQARALRRRIRETHFRLGSLEPDGPILDYPGNDRFDPLGGALSVLSGVAEASDYGHLLRGFAAVDSPTGVTIRCKHNPISAREKQIIAETDGVVTWPFVVGFTVLALLRMGERALAEEQFAKMTRHDGFREYYDPRTGEGFGEQEQLWSATLSWRAYQALRNNTSPS